MRQSYLDKIGMTASTACAVHCAIVPMIIGFLPAVGLSFLAHSWLEWTMVGLAGVVGIMAMLKGHAIHKKHTALCLFVPGIALIITGLIMFNCACANTRNLYGYDPAKKQMVVIRTVPAPYEFPWRAVVMSIGGLIVAASHFVNSYMCKKCTTCNH